jgi:hypothetical protein
MYRNIPGIPRAPAANAYSIFFWKWGRPVRSCSTKLAFVAPKEFRRASDAFSWMRENTALPPNCIAGEPALDDLIQEFLVESNENLDRMAANW